MPANPQGFQFTKHHSSGMGSPVYTAYLDGERLGAVWSSWNRLLADHWCNDRCHSTPGLNGTCTEAFKTRRDAAADLAGVAVVTKRWTR